MATTSRAPRVASYPHTVPFLASNLPACSDDPCQKLELCLVNRSTGNRRPSARPKEHPPSLPTYPLSRQLRPPRTDRAAMFSRQSLSWCVAAESARTDARPGRADPIPPSMTKRRTLLLMRADVQTRGLVRSRTHRDEWTQMALMPHAPSSPLCFSLSLSLSLFRALFSSTQPVSFVHTSYMASHLRANSEFSPSSILARAGHGPVNDRKKITITMLSMASKFPLHVRMTRISMLSAPW